MHPIMRRYSTFLQILAAGKKGKMEGLTQDDVKELDGVLADVRPVVIRYTGDDKRYASDKQSLELFFNNLEKKYARQVELAKRFITAC